MEGSNTTIVISEMGLKNANEGNTKVSPRLYICCDHDIVRADLQGRQRLGRPAGEDVPEIPVMNQHVSKDHGVFMTSEEGCEYIAGNSSNGIYYNNRRLYPTARVSLSDGDELRIPTADKIDILIVFVNTGGRAELWEEFRQASRDQLTGLNGRNGFMNWWTANRDHREYGASALFIMDIDNFKQINDGFGHSTGDEVLRFVAGQLVKAAGFSERVCRWGGDEFIGIIPGKQESADRILKRLCKEISESSIIDTGMSVSIGCVDLSCVEDRMDLCSLVSIADKALYETKRNGKNGVEWSA
ncbi:MAG: GGDEF domain-containing protein [Lachnospiraceae bacterium]|nr:GGDEF domain-containing protein [Lachnospiraceae bacterium]